MSSPLSNKKRRTPTQDRSSERLKLILKAAENLIAEVGYDAVTMTEIAARAETSIGSVYQYYPDKEAVMQALFARYGEELEACWVPLMEVAPRLSPAETATQLVDFLVEFIDSHPAYLPLHDAPLKLIRSTEARDRLRRRIADAFCAQKPGLEKDEAWRICNVAIQILKGVGALYGRGPAQGKGEIVREIKFALSAYLSARLGGKALN